MWWPGVLLLCLPLLVTANAENNFLNNIIESLMAPTGMNVSRLLSSFEVAPCMRQCMPSVGQVLDALAAAHAQDTQALDRICQELISVQACASSSACSSSLYDLVSRTYRFVCVERVEDVGATLDCMRKTAISIRTLCETQCDIQMVPRADQVVDINKLCNSSVCLLGCVEKGVDAQCRGSDMSLIDSILASSSADNKGNTIDTVIQSILPSQCRQLQQQGIMDLPNKINLQPPRKRPSSVGKVRDSFLASTVAPMSVGSPEAPTLRPIYASAFGSNAVETDLLINGQMRTLQCQALDYDRNPVQTPEFTKLAQIIAKEVNERSFIDGRIASHPIPFWNQHLFGEQVDNRAFDGEINRVPAMPDSVVEEVPGSPSSDAGPSILTVTFLVLTTIWAVAYGDDFLGFL